MYTKLFSIIFAMIVPFYNVLSQQDTLVDVFPLTVGNEWTYQGQTSFSDLEEYTGSSVGTSTFTIIDSIAYADSTIWKFKDRTFFTFWIHYIYTNIDTSFSIVDTIYFDMIELHFGRHQLYRLEDQSSIGSDPFPFTRSLTETTMVYRFCSVDSGDTIQYQTRDPNSGCFVYTPTFKKGIGLMKIKTEPACIGAPYDIEHHLINSVINNIGKSSNNVSTGYRLNQNYPNPFNPATTIEYNLPHRTYLTLHLFDILGREVTTIVEGTQERGTHQVTLTMSNLPSGVYYYQLVANNISLTKKLIYLK